MNKLLVVLISLSISSQAMARTPSRALHWYEGGQKKTVYLNEDVILEFSTAKGAITGATRLKPLGKSGDPLQVTRDHNAKSAVTKTSPVFHDNPVATRSKRALPGNIIVKFNSDWDESKIREWATSKGLEIEKKLLPQGNVYVIKSEAGMAALELANSIHESGEVVSAEPVWWVPMAKR